MTNFYTATGLCNVQCNCRIKVYLIFVHLTLPNFNHIILRFFGLPRQTFEPMGRRKIAGIAWFFCFAISSSWPRNRTVCRASKKRMRFFNRRRSRSQLESTQTQSRITIFHKNWPDCVKNTTAS